MTKKPDDWMPLHIGRYLANTAHLTRDQHGAYLLLLMAYWTKGGPLVADDARLAATAKATLTEWRKLRPVLVEFFTEQDGMWIQKKAEQELARANAITEAKSEAGKRGADKRWHSDSSANGKRKALPSNSHKQIDTPQPQPSPSPTSSLRSEESRASRFGNFWAVCPKKVGKGKSQTLFDRACRETSPDLLIAAMQRYAASRAGEDQQFTKHPATWLSQKCWEDEGTGPPQASAEIIALRSAFSDPEELELQRQMTERTYGKATN